MIDEINGNNWFTNEYNQLAISQPLSFRPSGEAQGTITLPKYTWLDVNETIKVPMRIAVMGTDIHTRDMPGFRASTNFNSSNGTYLLEVLKAPNNNQNWNGNFGQHFRNLNLDGKGVADGLFFGGAQVSSVENLTIYNAKDTALYIAPGSGRIRLQDIDIRMRGPNSGQLVGQAIYLNGARGGGGSNVNVHVAETGIWFRGTHNFHIGGLVFEKVTTPIKITEGSTNVELNGIDIQYPGEVILDLTNNRGGVTITGTVRKAPSQTYYLDWNGIKRPFIVGATTSGGRGFTVITTNFGKTVTVKVHY